MALAIVPQSVPAIDATFEHARTFADASHADNTHRAYSSDLRLFSKWCISRGFLPLPATSQVVALYASDLAQTSKIATVKRHLAAIAFNHRESALESPVAHEVVRRIVRGIARTNGASQVRKSALTVNDLRRVLLTCRGDGLKAKRDRAIFLLGFAAALRRSEIAAIRVEDLAWSTAGLRLTIRRSKTDQNGAGVDLPIPFIAEHSLCAARAVREWLDLSGFVSGPLFRSFDIRGNLRESSIAGQDVKNLIKRAAEKARLEGDYSGHSLRSGFVTSAAEANISLDRIAAITRHKSMTVLAGYIRRADLFSDPVLTSIAKAA